MSEEQNQLVTISNVSMDIATSPEFKEVLLHMPTVIDKAKRLLATPANEDDEDTFAQTQKDLEELNRYAKRFEAVKKEIRKRFDDQKKLTVENFDEVLIKSGYDELKDIQKQIKQRKTMITENRKAQRWDEIEQFFNELLDETYPDVKEHLPEINFKNFQAQHDKLVTGAKTYRFNDKIKNVPIDYLNQSSKDLASILAMKSLYEKQLLSHYEQTRDLADVVVKEKKLEDEDKERQRKRAEQMKQQEERIKKENEKAKQVAKLQNKQAEVKETKHIKKLYEVYKLVTDAANNEGRNITDQRAEAVLDEVRAVLDR